MKEIARTVGVSLSSVSLWVRHVPLSEAQRVALQHRMSGSGRDPGAPGRRTAARRVRQGYQADGRERARKPSLLHAAGCMLYWAEGTKGRNAVTFVNSDPAMVRYFVEFLRREYGIRDEQFTVSCNLFADHVERQREIEQFWLTTLELPDSCLRKSVVNVYSKYSTKKRRNRLPHGTVRVRVHSTAVVQSIYGAIQEYGGFERPEWLG